MPRKTIIIATSNKLQSKHISALIESLPDFSVVACTGDLMNTYNHVETKLPTAVLISDSLAGLPEFEVMRGLFATLDVRWLVLTAPNKSHRSQASANKGSDLFSVPGNASAAIIEGQLRSLTRSRPCRRPSSLNESRTDAQNPNFGIVSSGRKQQPRAKLIADSDPSSKTKSRFSTREQIILIGSSTGGVDALLKILSSFPSDCPPTLIVQHTGSGFGESLAGLLNRQCAAKVSLAKEPTLLQRGTIIIGAGNGAHIVLDDGQSPKVTLSTGSHVSGHKPSVDVLFKSCVGRASQVSAAILTGMGRDGADGLLELYQAGARTIAQDEASSVVYGMPRAAVEIGAAQTVLPVEKIGPTLLQGNSRQNTQPRRATP